MAKPQYDYSEIARLREEEDLTWREICERIGAPEASASTIRRGYERRKGTRVRVDGHYVKVDESDATILPPSDSSPPADRKPEDSAGMASRQSSASPPAASRQPGGGAAPAKHQPSAISEDLLNTLTEMAKWWKGRQIEEDGAEPAKGKPRARRAPAWSRLRAGGFCPGVREVDEADVPDRGGTGCSVARAVETDRRISGGDREPSTASFPSELGRKFLTFQFCFHRFIVVFNP